MRSGGLRWRGAVGLAVAWWVACGADPEPPVTRALKTHRLALEYPASWTLDSEPGRNEGLFMGLHELSGSSSARIFLSAYDAQAPFAAADVASMHVDSVQGVVKDTRRPPSPVQAEVGGIRAEGVELRFSRQEAGGVVPHTVQVFTLQSDGRTASVVVQLADRDRERERSNIELVLRSLRLF